MSLIFLGIFASLCGLEVVERTVLGGSVVWTLHSAGLRVNGTFLALFAVHWLRAGTRAERGLLVAFAAVIGFVFAAFLGGQFKSGPSLVGLTLVHASIATNLVGVVREKGISPARLRAMRDAWFIPLIVLLSTPMIDLSTHFGPLNDAHIFRFEEMLGIRVESVVYDAVAAVPFGHTAMHWIYDATAALFVIPLLTTQPRRNPIIPAMVGVGLLGYGFYILCPAVGIFVPDYYRSIWPASLPTGAAFADPASFIGIPRNTVPSIHAACAYLLMFNAWRFPPSLRRALLIFGVLTLLSAIDIGAHWATDLLSALPFTLATMALTDPDPSVAMRARAPIVAGGYALTLLWVFAFRDSWLVDAHSAALGWSAIVLTLVASVVLRWRYNAATSRHRWPQALPALVPSR